MLSILFSKTAQYPEQQNEKDGRHFYAEILSREVGMKAGGGERITGNFLKATNIW